MDHSEEHSFDETYAENEEMFGHPYKELQDYFEARPKGTLLDLGCGQGRDAIYLASIGYDVTAVDTSAVGIQQMVRKAKKQGLQVSGVVADVLTFVPKEQFDVILFDMLLHSFEEKEQVTLLEKYSRFSMENICLVFPDDVSVDHVINTMKAQGWGLFEKTTVHDVPNIGEEEIDYAFVMWVFSPDAHKRAAKPAPVR